MKNKSQSNSKKNFELFKSGRDWHNNACVNRMHDSNDAYIDGYKDAADILAEHCLKTQEGRDTLIYPIIFLYRQSIELLLKQIILRGSILIENPQDYPPIHNINKLWQICRGLLEKVWPKASPGKLNKIEKIIYEFSEVDPKSMTFRYVTDNKGKRLLTSDITHINIRNLKEQMDTVVSLLYGANCAIDHSLTEMEDCSHYI